MGEDEDARILIDRFLAGRGATIAMWREKLEAAKRSEGAALAEAAELRAEAESYEGPDSLGFKYAAECEQLRAALERMREPAAALQEELSKVKEKLKKREELDALVPILV